MLEEDPRFSTANHPAFGMRRGGRRNDARNETITDDKRFSAVETDERFSMGGTPKVDKYGRNVSLRSGAQATKKIKSNKKMKGRSGDGIMNPILQPQLAVATSRREIEKRMDILNKLARGEASANISSDETSSSSEYSVEEDSDIGEVEATNSTTNTLEQHRSSFPSHDGLLDEESIPEGNAYNRIALLNCDWEHMNSKDLLALVTSFCSKGEIVISVTIYESDYGKQHMELESKHGPGPVLRSIEKQLKKVPNVGHSRDGHVIHRKRKGIVMECDQRLETSDGAEPSLIFDPEIVRAYELQKLRYYFAVIKCSSINCAETIYAQLDGMEFETSSVALDLRFVPDEITFDGKTVRDTATFIPTDYSPPDFVLKAFQQSNVECSWDAPPAERKILLKGSSTQGWEEANEEELEKFLQGSSDDDADSSDEERLLVCVKKARQALLGYNTELLHCHDNDNVVHGNTKKDEGSDDGSENALFVDMGQEEHTDEEHISITRNRKRYRSTLVDTESSPGSKRYSSVASTAAYKVETPSQVLNSRKLQDKCERRNMKRAEREGIIVKPQPPQQQRDADASLIHGSRRDLMEIIDEDVLDFDMRALEREDKLKGKKLRGKRKRKELKREKAAGQGFEVDVNDPRFSAVLEGTDDQFGIDKTAPEFRDTEGMNRILETRLRRHKEREERMSNTK